MNKLLQLMLEGEALSTQQMAEILGYSSQEFDAEIQNLKEKGILLGFRPVINPDIEENIVHAAIELKISPDRDGGFNRLARRISKFDQVDSCYLMSGAYDLLLFVRAKSMRGIASFVYEKLATIDGVNSTATHFFLKTYKQQGYLIDADGTDSDRLIYSP